MVVVWIRICCCGWWWNSK